MNRIIMVMVVICLASCAAIDSSVVKKTSPIENLSIGLLDIYVNDEKTYERLLDLGYKNIEIIELPLLGKDISKYDILYIPYGWASYGDKQFKQIEADSELVHQFVSAGGSLFVGQPNPYMNGKEHTVTPNVLPYMVAFSNEPTKFKYVSVDSDHPITMNLSKKDVPSSGDSLLFIAPEYNAIIKAENPASSPLLVAKYGKGKILICTHSASKKAIHPTGNEIFIRMVNWLVRDSQSAIL